MGEPAADLIHEPRYRYMLTPTTRYRIRATLSNVLANTALMPEYHEHVLGIIEELDVAEARALMDPDQVRSDHVVYKAAPDTIPVLLADHEAALINTFPTIPFLRHPAVRARVT